METSPLDLLEASLGREGNDSYVVHDGIRKLLAAMLVRGLRDLSSPIQQERREAIDWLFSRERAWVFSAYYCSYALGLEVEALQDFILHNYPEAKKRTGLRPQMPALQFKYPKELDLRRMIKAKPGSPIRYKKHLLKNYGSIEDDDLIE